MVPKDESGTSLRLVIDRQTLKKKKKKGKEMALNMYRLGSTLARLKGFTAE